MKEKYKEIFVIILFAILTIFVFRNYFIKKTVPFPANLLVSFYQPWAQYQWKDYASGPPNKPIGFDSLRIFYPLRKLNVEQIKDFEFPLWNPYNFSGNTLLATYQAAVFHPLSFLFFILPQIDAWSAVVILAPFLTSTFMYFFLKEINLSRRASLFGAIIFAFSGFMIVWWEESFMSAYSALFLPLILYGTNRLLKKLSARDFVFLVGGLSFSILSGWFQMTLYVWFFSIIYLVYFYIKNAKRKKETLFIILFAYFLSLLVSAIHLIPGFEAFSYSARATTDVKFIFDVYLLPLYYLITFIAPDFFGNPAVYSYFSAGFYYERMLFVGIPALIFALYELISFSKINNKENFFKLCFIISLSLGFSLPTSWAILYYLKLPLISVILPSRVLFLSTFCISILAAFGLEKYVIKKEKKGLIIILSLIGLILFALWAFVLFQKIYRSPNNFSLVSLRNLVIPTVIYILTLIITAFGVYKQNFKFKMAVLIIAVSFASSFYFANKYLFFSDRSFVYPNTPVISEIKKISGINRFWGVGKGYIDRNFATYYDVYSPEGYDSFYIKRYGELLFAGLNKGKYSEQIPRSDAVLSGINTLPEVQKDPYRERLISLLGVKYIIGDYYKDKGKVENTNDFVKIWNDKNFIIYEYKNVLPRIMLFNDYVILKDNQKILDNIFNKKTDLSKTVILEEEPENFVKGKTKKSSIKLVSYKPNKITIEVQTDINSILFISDNYFPGWKAYVDQNPTKIYRANYSFRSIVVPSGKHLIAFNYQPGSFYLGLITSIIGLLLLLIFCIKIRYKQKNV